MPTTETKTVAIPEADYKNLLAEMISLTKQRDDYRDLLKYTDNMLDKASRIDRGSIIHNVIKNAV